jgi:hypothetical protein
MYKSTEGARPPANMAVIILIVLLIYFFTVGWYLSPGADIYCCAKEATGGIC